MSQLFTSSEEYSYSKTMNPPNSYSILHSGMQNRIYRMDTPVLDLSVRKLSTTSESSTSPQPLLQTSLSPNSEVFSDTSNVTCPDQNCCCGTSTRQIRPFKAFPREIVSAILPMVPQANSLWKESDQAYIEFRNQVLPKMKTGTTTNKNMQRVQKSKQSDDPYYLEKRRKNNEAAKRSRDARKAKEDEMAIRCAFLERENLQLKLTVDSLKNQVKRLGGIFS